MQQTKSFQNWLSGRGEKYLSSSQSPSVNCDEKLTKSGVLMLKILFPGLQFVLEIKVLFKS